MRSAEGIGVAQKKIVVIGKIEAGGNHGRAVERISAGSGGDLLTADDALRDDSGFTEG